MAYTAVPTAYDNAPGWTATWLNRYVKDNFAAGVPDIFTTKGDIAAATAADTATRHAVGADGLILAADSSISTGMLWTTPGIIKVNDPDSYGGIAEGWSKLTNLDNEYYDSGGQWASDRFTNIYPGSSYYVVSCMFQIIKYNSLNSYTNDDAFLWAIYKNGSLYSVIAGNFWVGGTVTTHIIVSSSGMDIIPMAKSDYLEFWVYANLSAGGYNVTINPNAEDVSHHISITYLPS